MAKRKDKDNEPKVTPSQRTAETRQSKSKASAEAAAAAIEAASNKPATGKVIRPKSGGRAPKPPKAPKPSKNQSAQSRARMERLANSADFLNAWFVDPSGNKLLERGEANPQHELVQLMRQDPSEVSRILSDYNLTDLPDEIAQAFGETYVPPEYDEETEKYTSGFIPETVSIEQGLRRDVDTDVDEYDPSQDPDYGDPARSRSGASDLGNILGRAGLESVGRAARSAELEEGTTVSDAQLRARSADPNWTGGAGFGPVTRGRIYTSRPSTGEPARQGATNRPQTVVPRTGRILRPTEIDALIRKLGPTAIQEVTRMVDPRKVNIDISSRGKVDVPVVSAEEAYRAAKADKQSILSRDQLFALANEGSLSSPDASGRVRAQVQEHVPLSPEDLMAPEGPNRPQFVEQGVRAVSTARANDRLYNQERAHLGTMIARLAEHRNVLGLNYRGTDQKVVRDEETGGRKTIQVPRVKTVFENTDAGPDWQRLAPETIQALKDAGYGGLFGGSLTQGGARIGRPQGDPLTATRNGRKVSYDVDDQGNITQTDVATGDVTERSDISVRRAPTEDPDKPLRVADLDLLDPFDTSTVDPLSKTYNPVTQLGIPWGKTDDYQGMADNPEQVDDIRKMQADALAKTAGKDMPQGLREGKTGYPQGVKRIRGQVGEATDTPGPTKIQTADSKIVGPGITAAAAREGMSPEDIVESMRKITGYMNWIEGLARPSGVSAYAERIFDATTVPGGVLPTDFPVQRAAIRTASGRPSNVEVQVPTADTIQSVLDSIDAARKARGKEPVAINSPEQFKLIESLGVLHPETKKPSFYTPTAEETAAFNARQEAARAAEVTRIRSDKMKAVKRRLGAPRPADVEAAGAAASYWDKRTGENERVDTLGFEAQHAGEAQMYIGANLAAANKRPVYNTNVRGTMPPPAGGQSAAAVNAAKMRTTGRPATGFDLQYHELQRQNLPNWVVTSTMRGKFDQSPPKGSVSATTTAQQDELIMAGASDEPNEGAFSSAMMRHMGGQFNPPSSEAPFDRSVFNRSPESLGYSNDPTRGPVTRQTLLRPVVAKQQKPKKERKAERKAMVAKAEGQNQ